MKYTFSLIPLLCALLLAACSDHSSLQGKPLGAWVAQLQPSNPARLRLQAVQTLAESVRKNPAASPLLVAPEILEALDRALADRDPDVRLQAALALAWVGHDAGLTVPVLLEAMRDDGIPALHEAVEPLLRYRDRAADVELSSLLDRVQKILPDFDSIDVTSTTGRTNSQLQQLVDDHTARLSNPSAPLVLAALEALGQLGPHAASAVPAINRLLASNDPRLRTGAVKTIDRLGPLAHAALDNLALMIFYDREPELRIAAARAILHLDPNTGSSVYYLQSALQRDGDARVRQAAAATLGDFGPIAKESLGAPVPPELFKAVFWPRTLAIRMVNPAIGPLLAALKDADAGVRAEAARTLGRISPSKEKVTPALLTACGDAEPRVRAAAAWSLGELPATAPAARERLQGLLKDSSPLVRGEALYALVRLAQSDAAVTPLLETAAADAAPEVKRGLLHALDEVGPAVVWASKPLSAAVVQLAQNPDPGIRAAALTRLARVDLRTDESVQALARALEDRDRRVVRAAAAALGWMGPAADAAVPALDKLTHSPDAETRLAATLALGWIDHRSAAALQRLIKEMRAPGFWTAAIDDEVCTSSARWREGLLVLGWRGLEAEPAAPVAAGLLRDRHNPSDVRLLAGMALTAISTETFSVQLSPVFQTVRARYHERQLEAATALIWLGDKAAPALPELLRVLQARSCNEDLRVAAAAAVGRLGAATASHVQDLCDVMRAEPSSRVKAAIASILGGLGVGGKTSTPPLIAALKDADPGVREAAALALGKIAMDAPFTIPALGKTLEDAEPRVRLAAVMSLGGYGAAARDTVTTLSNLAATDADQLVRQAAGAALKKINGE